MSFSWRDISWGAMSLALEAHRIAEKREVPKDRIYLKEFGDHLAKLCTEGPAEEDKHQMLSGQITEGVYLALQIEKDYLQGDRAPKEVKPIRDLGVTSLDRLAWVLQQADTPEFNRYAEAIDLFFRSWKSWAEELSIPRTAQGFDSCGGKGAPEIIAEVVTRFPYSQDRVSEESKS